LFSSIEKNPKTIIFYSSGKGLEAIVLMSQAVLLCTKKPCPVKEHGCIKAYHLLSMLFLPGKESNGGGNH
jgi:hypothetical protein